MAFVRASALPTSTSAGELRQLFSDIGEVSQIVLIFRAGSAEGEALVAYKSAAAAAEAVDLLDGYPLGTSLLEVEVRSPLTCRRLSAWKNFVRRLPLPAPPPGARGSAPHC